MKKPVFLAAALVSFVLVGATVAQEATPDPEAAPPTPTPEAAGQKPAPTPEISDKTTPTPSTESSPSNATPAEVTPDRDILPEPTDASLGELTTAPAEDGLPTETTPGDLPNPDTLIPPGEPGDENEPPPPPNIAENKFQQERKLKVRYQEVKLQALKEASVRNLRDQAEKAKNDEAKRQALREYYRLLFAKMVAIDSSLQQKCDEMQNAYLRRLGQYRVEPTIPLNPPPTPEPLEIAEASSTPKSKPNRGN